MSEDVCVLGASGRSGRGIARRLHETGHTVVLAGRDTSRLATIAAGLGGVDMVSGDLDALLAQLRRAAPGVVVNTIGPFARTSVPVAQACPPGTHYSTSATSCPAPAPSWTFTNALSPPAARW